MTESRTDGVTALITEVYLSDATGYPSAVVLFFKNEFYLLYFPVTKFAYSPASDGYQVVVRTFA